MRRSGPSGRQRWSWGSSAACRVFGYGIQYEQMRLATLHRSVRRVALAKLMPPFSRLVIPDLLLAEVIRHTRAELPNECCGLLAGHIANGVGIVTTRFAVENAL